MKVSKENLWIGILTVLMMAIMLIPFPATIQKILWILNMAGALGIVVGAIVSIIRKYVPKVFQEGIKYYLMYSMAFTVTSIRYLFWFKTKRDEIPMISKLLETEYQNNTHITLLLFFILFVLALTAVLQPKNKKLEDTLACDVSFLKYLIIIFGILLPASIIFCCAIGVDKLGMGYKEAFFFYLPYISVNSFIYFLPFFIASSGLNVMINSIYKESK